MHLKAAFTAHPPANRAKTYAATASAVAATAVLGGLAVDADSPWYRRLDKPRWQPPSRAFGLVWTPLYVSVAAASGRALLRARPEQRRRLIGSLAGNLVLNAGWNWLFFGCRSTRAGLAGTLLLDASNVHLIRRTAAADRPAARALLPYAAWCVFATALNADLAYRNRARGAG
ncbi:TspO/MBR family protein [Streptomyces sp. NPDC000987]|uniref:TspO/MBR family protein n=1 Tax=Streptomyces sp. NPDC000987 TaxID=3154374 RepID=UPI003321A76F